MTTSTSYTANMPSTSSLSFNLPSTVPVEFSAIPSELVFRPQWVVWRWEFDNGNQQLKKPPFDPRNGRPASHSDPATWGTFADTVTTYSAGGYDGIGFVFTRSDPYVGGDLDNSCVPGSGAIKPWAMQIIQELDSYTELSPSGTGIKVFLRGKLPPKGRVTKVRDGKIEIYDSSRYFTVTGQMIAGLPTALSDRQKEIDSLHRRLFPQPKPIPPHSPSLGIASAASSSLISDYQIFSLLTAKPLFRRLWTGDASLWTTKKRRYPSQSEADAALVSRLARLTPDAAQIDRIFRQSGLMRAKWDEVHYVNKDTYGQGLIADALGSNRPMHVEFSVPPEAIQIHRDDYAAKLRVTRSTLTQRNGVFLDRSPCGVGKTTALLGELCRFPSSLVSCPTHENCRDFVRLAQQNDVHVVAYPQLDSANCENVKRASDAQASGLDLSETVCRNCPAKNRCGRRGYRKMLRDFQRADHQVVTHERVSLTGLSILANGKSLVVAQEDALRFLRSSAAIPYADWETLQCVLHRVLRSGPDAQIAGYASQLLQALAVVESAQHHNFIHQIKVRPLLVTPPTGWHDAIHNAISASAARITADALHGASDLLSGRAEAFYCPKVGGKSPKPMRVVVVRRADLPASSRVLLEDHTADLDAVQVAAGCPVWDTTSIAFPEAIHRVVQYPVDVKKGTTKKTAVDELRGILLARPQARSIGVICHKVHKSAIERMEPAFRNRIKIVDYFWSGNGRASNRWHKQCDLLVILGTPRVGESAVHEHLIRQGVIDAAKRNGGFTEAIGLGETETGRQRAFLTLSYSDNEWNAAYRQLVVAELMQSVGRSRFIRPEGIPETIVVSNEPLDLPLADDNFSRITSEQAELYFALVSAADAQQPRLSQTSYRGGGTPAGMVSRGWVRKVPSIYYGEFRTPVPHEQQLPVRGIGHKRLAEITGTSPSTVRGRLKRLCDARLISKCSHGGVWPVVFPG